MTSITVTNRQRGRSIDVERLRVFARAALAACLQLRVKKPTSLRDLSEIHVLLVSDKRIAALHQRYMTISTPTDVITFQHGEIVISADTAAQNARAFSSSLERELQLYIVHGLLHLQSFDDRTARDAARMARTQARIIAGLV